LAVWEHESTPLWPAGLVLRRAGGPVYWFAGLVARGRQ